MNSKIIYNEQDIKYYFIELEVQVDHVFTCLLAKDLSHVCFIELCDQNFYKKLNRNELMQLISKLSDLHSRMKY